jgi:putative redox protein
LRMDVSFPGRMKVDVDYKGHTIKTDQPRQSGGGGADPSPFDLFLASIGACAGFYALNFCKARKISTEGLGMSVDLDYDEAEKMVVNVRINLKLPMGFPKEYNEAILRSVKSCTVKKHIKNPPKFEVLLSE